MNSIRLHGVMPPLTTPFLGGEVDLEKLRANIEQYNKTGLSGYLVLGSNGENVFLSESERVGVLKAAREAIPGNLVFMAGTGLESTRETVRFTNQAADAGADCALVITPFYFKARMTPDALRAHFERVAEKARIPILLYNVPQFTGINMSPGFVAELSKHRNIVGIKDSSGNIGQLSEIIRLSTPNFAVFVGSAPVFFPALCMGAKGGILAAANVIPELLVSIQRLFAEGFYDKARELQQKVNPLCQWVTTGHGIGGLKVAMDAVGYYGGEVRLPLMLPVEDVHAEVTGMIKNLLPELSVLKG